LTESLVSIIIPTYNRAPLLLQAIQSCVDQTYRPIECIIVDDGSTDNTKDTIAKIEKWDVSSFTVKYIHQQNAGSQVARNTGTAASTGEFIQYLDSDDLLYPDKIKNQVTFLQENKDCDGVWGGWAKGTVEKNETIESFACDDLLTQFLTAHCIHTLAFLMRRTLIQKIGPWDVNIKRNQEIDFQVRGLLVGANYEYQSQIGGLWRIHEGERIASTTGTKEILNFYHYWEKKLNNQCLFNEEMKKNIANTYLWLANSDKGNKSESLRLLAEVVRLNPDIPFMQTWKMRLLHKIFGLKMALKIWRLRSNINPNSFEF
jgi:glycosyltransferase involved in cell wall biosynthesis